MSRKLNEKILQEYWRQRAGQYLMGVAFYGSILLALFGLYKVLS